MWNSFGDTINNAFYFVVDKIIDLQNFFIGQAKTIGSVVLLIAILTAALNYALTGTGLKENIIKIGKATLFFLIVIFAYPRIISFITSWTFDMAAQSIYPSVKSYFNNVTETITTDMTTQIDISSPDNRGGNNTFTFTRQLVSEITKDRNHLFNNISETRNTPQMSYTTVAPAAVIQVILFIAGECIAFADKKENIIFPEFSRILKGLLCAFFLMFTGVFALLEYIVCFLEFMLVASVGVILFPMSIWEGSKFLSEKFIGAIIGFFMKLLFCNIAIFLMLYGFISLFYILSGDGNTFTGNADQMIFIIFTCLLFFFICKSAPGIAQSLLSGTPSLSASGAIAAVGGAVAAAGAVASMPGNMRNAAKSAAGSVVGGVTKAGGVLAEANSAAKAAGLDGGSRMNQAGAFMSSLGKNASQNLVRSIYGGQSGGQSLGEIKESRQQTGAQTGLKHMDKVRGYKIDRPDPNASTT
ncbi:MAG: hypothetical protein LBB89_02900 [Treponema sp.]|jgi:hypothetical protein|nr:hypothetical protein [Treponema sp.]